MNLRDLADAALLVGWYGSGRAVPTRHVDPPIAGEFWKYVGFLNLHWQRDAKRGRTPGDDGSTPRLHEEVLVAMLLIRTVAAQLDERAPPARPGRGLSVSSPRMNQIDRIRQGVLANCRQIVLSLPERLRLQRLDRRVSRWECRLTRRAGRGRVWGLGSEPCSLPNHRHSNEENVACEELSLMLERAALRWTVPSRTILDQVRRAVYVRLMEIGLCLVSPFSFSGEGLIRNRLHRRIEEGCHLDVPPIAKWS